MIKTKIKIFLIFLFWSPVAHANDCANYPYKNGVQREHSDDGRGMLFSTYTFHHNEVESNIGITSIQDYGFSRAMEQLHDYIKSENKKDAIIKFEGLLQIASCEEPGKMQKATVIYKSRDIPGVSKE